MFTLKVSGMTCGGCIKCGNEGSLVSRSLCRGAGGLATQTVTLATTVSQEQASQLITKAGFPVAQ